MSTNYTNNTNKNRSSFTLIELLVVLALVAILSVVVIVTLNPAELLKQARDSNRLSDLATINTALNLFSADVTSGFMGTSTIIYVSIPDSSPTCANLGLPILATSSYTYNCVTTQNLRKTDGTGWIPVNFQRISSNSPISQLPIDPQNTTTTNSYYTYIAGGSWKLTAIALESQKYIAQGNTDGGTAPSSFEMGNNMSLGQTVFPNNWIKVPGNSTFGTSDFWVMKYEAKCADSSGNLLTTPTESTYQIYNAHGTGGTACTSANSRYVTSAPAGYPIANIYYSVNGVDNDAIEYCQSIGAHLITNNEWQTVAWNAQNVSSNWSGGSVGSGYMGRGNSDSSAAQVSSLDDVNAAYLTGYTDFTHRRNYALSNGQIIWDLAGNLYEWTNDAIIGASEPYSGVAGWQWREFIAITNWGTMTQQTAGPLNSAWSATQGMGRIFSWDGTANSSTYILARGGDWNDTTNAGIESLLMNRISTGAYNGVGFRCVR